MTVSGIGNKLITYTLSGLGNNSSSIIPMAVKDTISNCAIVNTYRKEGTPDDVREKAIEEFGTGAIWLFGIPTLKKIINKTVYPLFGLDSGLDLRALENKEKFQEIKDSLKNVTEENLLKQKNVLETLNDKGKFLNKFSLPFTNKQLYKGMFYGKFLASTVACAFLLNKIIKYKQKTTDDRIKKDYFKNNTSKILLYKNMEKDSPFKKQEKQKNDISFTSISSMLKDFMYNPIKNTSILDGVITSTRLKEARKGERKEVGLKEVFQLFFIYCIAKPLQDALEWIGNNKISLPIETDAKVIFDKDLKTKLEQSKETFASLKNSSTLTKDILSLDPKSVAADLLANNKVINLIKDKNKNIIGIDRLGFIDEEEIKKALNAFEKLNNNIGRIKGIKLYKAIAVLGNVAFAAWAMGVLQPKVNILMRKLLNDGDNSNPAIKSREKMYESNITFKNPLKTHQG